jgi:SAM-dependent methyltransferase
VTEFDQLAEHYDETRGGEQRGDEYAADIDAELPHGDGVVLEIGVGTGVVALGLRRRGRAVIGLDLSTPMLIRAMGRLGPVLVRSDAMCMSIATASIAHAVSVWVVHSVAQPTRLFREVARVVSPGGLYVVSVTQRPSPEDRIGWIISEMSFRVDVRRGAPRPRGVSVEEVLDWAGDAGFTGCVRERERQWISSPDQELNAITRRQWPALRELDEDAIEEVTRPAVEELRALPATDVVRRATAETVVLRLA